MLEVVLVPCVTGGEIRDGKIEVTFCVFPAVNIALSSAPSVYFCGNCSGLLDHVTVLIGIAVNGEAVAGVIHQPYFNYQNEEPGIELGRTIWGIVGLGR